MPFSATVEELKQKIINLYDVPIQCLRLIFQGRLMSNKDKLSSFGFNSGKNYLHCSIAPKPSQDQTQVDIPDDNPRGFDRLREMGFPVDDIREVREQFYNTRPRLPPNITREELYQMEEDFLRSGLTTSERQSAQEQRERQDQETGDSWDLVIGMIMGFFLGIIMLFWIWENTIPTMRKRCGILLGIGCNMCFCLLKALF